MSGGGIEAVLTDLLMAHTDETCSDRECGYGFGYHDCDSREERRRGCEHLAAQVLAWLDARLAEGDVVEAVARVLCGMPKPPSRNLDLMWQVWGEAQIDATAALSAVRGVLGGEGS